ncbi:unnamed protein product [Lathyrus oleraceus]
MFAYGNAHM